MVESIRLLRVLGFSEVKQSQQTCSKDWVKMPHGWQKFELDEKAMLESGSVMTSELDVVTVLSSGFRD